MNWEPRMCFNNFKVCGCVDIRQNSFIDPKTNMSGIVKSLFSDVVAGNIRNNGCNLLSVNQNGERC